MSDIKDYVDKSRAAGQTDDQIRVSLVGAGWQPVDIDAVLSSGAIPAPQNVSPTPSNNKLEIGTVIHSTLEFIKVHFYILAILTFIYFLANILPSFITLLPQSLPALSAIIIQIVLILIVVVVNISTTVALLDAIAENGMPQGGLSGAYRKGFSLLWRYFVVIFLVALVSFGGTLLLIIPGIIMSYMLLFAPYVVFIENKKGTEALAYSWYYMKGHAWQVIWFLLVIGMICWAVLFGITTIFTSFLHMASGSIPELVLVAAINSIIEPIAIVYLYQIYYRLKEIKGNPPEEDLHKKKVKLRILAVLGVLAIIGFAAGMFYLSAWTSNIYKNSSTNDINTGTVNIDNKTQIQNNPGFQTPNNNSGFQTPTNSSGFQVVPSQQ